ncbi:hypothetical protein SAMN05421676_101378 [Salinibacillus kushneri]|uniref:PRK06770 family protein n=1 Tax=Salinibacillus kushneri TaxID=237682 RepID=A0A1H9Z303_9BACI|nr:DUF6241 domain-containing protein [Salinibacillus kushneri]SES75886.1 hypothetical protein SAMN05421676_101378 [Salinibacillus kushneri]
MKKAWIIIGIIFLFIGGAFIGVYYGLTTTADGSESADNQAQEKIEEEREDIKGTITEKDLQTFAEQSLNPFGTEEKKTELRDVHFQEFIHGMSHQKVKASKKWGFYELHPKRVEWLLSALDQVEVTHEAVYRDILVKWSERDFTEVDQDHNAIWELQNGTVGKATGILSAEEEQAYIESQK